jgi:Uma2 family endonuclease
MNDVPAATLDEVVYPESDGKPMADNTLQWDWMVMIVEELRRIFKGQEVFVAGNLFWYPVEGDPHTVSAPDALVAFGRPPGYRGSYKQWKEGGIAPQVVFEVLSPSNTTEELEDKLRWYDRFGVEEYYLIDPYQKQVSGWVRKRGRLRTVDPIHEFESPRLKIRFVVNGGELKLFTLDGREFQTRLERESEIEFRAEQSRIQSEQAVARAEQERQRAQEAVRRAEQLAAKLRELGVNPDELPGGNS